MFGPVSEGQRRFGGAGQGADLHRVAKSREAVPHHHHHAPHAPLLPAYHPHPSHGFLNPHWGRLGRGPAEVQTAAHSSIAIQTEFSVLPIPRPPHCRRAVCSIYGMECVGINSFLVTSIVSPRQCRSVTLNASVTLPTAQRPLRCALLAPRIQRASDLATVPPALVKGIWQSSPSKPLSSPAYDEFRICHSPPIPLQTRSVTKGATTANAVWT